MYSREQKEESARSEQATTRRNTHSSSARDTAQHMQVSEQHQQYVVAAYHARFAGLWNEGSQGKHGSESPPEPAHQRALDLLPRDGEGMQISDALCPGRDKKRQRTAAKKRLPSDDVVQHAVCVEGPVPCAAIQHTGFGGKANKKMSKNGRHMLQSRDDITIFPRRKAGQDKLGSNRPPIVISRTVLESYFNMPQQKVCEKLVRSIPCWCLHLLACLHALNMSCCTAVSDTHALCALQGICATVIKKVCRQLGIDKWPFKGNKITLRKQGLGHGRNKSEIDKSDRDCSDGELDDENPGSPDTSETAPLSIPAPPPAPATATYQVCQQSHQSSMQQDAFRQLSAAETTRQAAHIEQAMQARRAPESNYRQLPANTLGSGHVRTHSVLMDRVLEVDRAMGEWRMGDAGGVFGWESRALFPGIQCARQKQLHGYQHQQQHHHSVGATQNAHRKMSQGPAQHFGQGAEGHNKFSPGSEVEVKTEMSEEHDNEDHGFDLSWLVPSEHSRGLDMDSDLLSATRFQSPFHYAEN